MVKHGTSHAAASLVCVVSGGLLGELLAVHLPKLKEFVEAWALPVLNRVGMDVGAGAVLKIIPVLLIGFIWGIAFKLAKQEV